MPSDIKLASIPGRLKYFNRPGIEANIKRTPYYHRRDLVPPDIRHCPYYYRRALVLGTPNHSYSHILYIGKV